MSLILYFLNTLTNIIPIIAPANIPRTIDTGILSIFNPMFIRLPLYIPINVEKIVIANTSSIEAPANIRVGMFFSFPRPLSIKRSIEGTITAGDTAAIINPNNPPCINVKLKSFIDI